LRLILFDGLRPALLGLILGLTASAGATRLIRSLLYGTAPYDPPVIAAVIAILLLIASLACIFPALRASRLNPMHALRTEYADGLRFSKSLTSDRPPKRTD
jgi:putative ABC transport system permease protein